MYNVFMGCEIVLKRTAILFELPMVFGRGVAGGGLLILVAGYAGVGKTHVSRLLADNFRCPLIDKDTICAPFSRYLADSCESETYLEEVRPREYASLYATLKDNLGFNRFVVATAPFIREVSSPDWWRFIDDLAGEFGHSLLVVWVTCKEDTMIERIRLRGESRDAWKLSNWDEYKAQNGGFSIPDKVDMVCFNEDNGLLFVPWC